MGLLDLFSPPKLQVFRAAQPAGPVVAVSQLEPFSWKPDDGSKFPGGFGATELPIADYWALRARSWQLFETNHYARGLITRLVTNEINTGLHLEATPEEALLGFPQDGLADWSETVENRFKLWASNAAICDETERYTFGELQGIIRLESLVAGDVLVVLRQDQRTKLPRIQIVPGERVQSPMVGFKTSTGNRIEHGVELDSHGRQVAYWVRQDDLTLRRLPAFGEKSGRRLALLVYGTEKRFRDVRGKPLLALVLQSLRELDRYRDSALRKAVVNSFIAAFVKKTQDKPGTKPITGGAVRRGTVTATDGAGAERSFRIAEQLPGFVIEELQQGEEPVPYPSHGTDERFSEFGKAILASIAWSRGVPPEIYWLSFSNNYSASQAAINEFKIHLNQVRTEFGEQVCQPLYVEWLLAETLAGKVSAPGLLEANGNFSKYDTFGAWVAADWSGNIKPAVDLSKLVKGFELAIAMGVTTRARVARELFGLKYSKVVQQLTRENAQLAEANKPLAELEASATPAPTEPDGDAPGGAPTDGENGDEESKSDEGETPQEEQLN